MKKVYDSIKGVISEKYSKEDLEKEAQRLSKVHNVPYDVVKHVINKETGGTWKTDLVNKKSGATGIMQILPKYATNSPAGYEVDKKDLLDPYKSMNAGVKKLSQWYNTHRNKKLPEDEIDTAAAKKAMASYNAGPGGIQKDKKGNITYTGAYKYIKTGNPKHLPPESQNYIKDFGVDNMVASSKLDKPIKREASSITPRIDPDKHKVSVPAVKSEPKTEPKSAVPSTENPYTPGSYEHAFKQARIEGKPEFIHNGKRIAVKLKDTSESTNKMKKVYEAAKHVLAEKSLKPKEGVVPGYSPPEQDWFAGARRLFSGEDNPRAKKKDADQEIRSAHVNIEKSQAEKAAAIDAARRESDKKGPSKDALAAISPVPVVKKAAQAPEVKKAAPAKKELSPFEKAFAAAREKGQKEFTWKNKEGKSYQVATKYKNEVSPAEPKVDTKPVTKVQTPVIRGVSKSVTSTSKSDSTSVSPEEMNDIDKQKETASISSVGKAERRAEVMDMLMKQANEPTSTPAKKTDDELKSDELWKDIRKELENETPEDKAARDQRIKKYKEEMNLKTNEENQMSINKKFNVSDALYSTVMEVMKKPSVGSAPRNEKEKDLAAKHGDPDVITHGDILKARGVKMKEENELGEGTMRNGKYVDDAPRPGTNELPVPDEGYRGPGKPLYTPVDAKKPMKKPQPGSTTKAMEEEIVQEMSSKQKMKLGLYNKKKSSVKENTDTPGNSYEHQCAIHVKSESFGEGRTITTQHADPDQDGNIAWYDVMFEHGIERHVPTAELEILVSESHMHSMKKKKK